MSTNAYELLALAMRYVFAALIVLIVIRAWFGASVDSQRAAQLRKLSPDTGIIGELLVMDGGERAKSGMRYPLTLEGTIGSSRRADIRIRHHSVRGRHAIYQMTDEGVFVRGHANLRIADGAGRSARELLLQDGDVLQVGGVRLMLVLTDGGNPVPEARRRRPRRKRGREEYGEDFFESDEDALDPDDLFRANPAAAQRWDESSNGGGPDAYDEYDDYDDYDDF